MRKSLPNGKRLATYSRAAIYGAPIYRAHRTLSDKPTAFLVYVNLLSRSGSAAQVQVRQSVIAEDLGLSLRSVERAIAVLKARGLVEVNQTRRAPFHWLPDHPHYTLEKAQLERTRARARQGPDGTATGGWADVERAMIERAIAAKKDCAQSPAPDGTVVDGGVTA